MTERRTVYLIGASAPPVFQYAEACRLLEAQGWQPCVVLTPTAATWVPLDELSRLTGFPVRVTPRMPGDSDPFPRRTLCSPHRSRSTRSTSGQPALPTTSLGLLCELMGAPDVSVLAASCVKTELRRHPAYGVSLNALRTAGVCLIDQERVVGRGPDGQAVFDWKVIISDLTYGYRPT